MKIRSKVLISFISLVILIALAIELLMHSFIQPQFAELEKTQLQRDIRSVENLIAQEARRIETTAYDWGVWDQTYTFIEDQNQDYFNSNLYPELNDDLELDFAFIVNSQGQVMWKLERFKQQPSVFLPANLWPTNHPLFNQPEVTTTGIADTSNGPLVFAVSKITQGTDKDPSNGILVFGRYLNEAFIQTVRERSQQPINLNIVESSEVSLKVSFPSRIEAVSQVLLPLFNSPEQKLQITLKVPRELNQQALETIHAVTLLTFFSGLILTLMVYLFLSRHILIPIERLNKQAEAFGQDSQSVQFSDSKRTDEIGALFKTFRLMANKILSYQRKLVQEKDVFQQASMTDQLTGLNNRRYLDTVLYESVNNQEGVIWQLMMLDLDHFKQVNDHYGHDVGDKVLQQFSKILQVCARHGDHIIRYGGEEFLIATRDKGYDTAEILAERLLQEMAVTPLGDSDNSFYKTCSIGFFCFRAPMLISLDDLERYISFADTALYAAKNSGRNRWIGIQAKNGKTPTDHRSLIKLIKEQNVDIVSSESLSQTHIDWT